MSAAPVRLVVATPPPAGLERRFPLSDVAVTLMGWRYLDLVHRTAMLVMAPAPARELTWTVEPRHEDADGWSWPAVLVCTWEPRGLSHMIDSHAWETLARSIHERRRHAPIHRTEGA